MVQDSLTIQTPAQARLLLAPDYGKLLAVLIAQQASASEAARQAGIPLKRTHHRLTQLLEAELICVNAEQRRGGRAIKLYRALAAEYSVPFELTDAPTLEDLLEQLYRPFLRALMREQANFLGESNERPRTVRLGLDANSQLSYNVGPLSPPGTPRGFSTARTILLKQEDAQHLRRELLRLHQWVNEHHSEEGLPYLLGLMLAQGDLEA